MATANVVPLKPTSKPAGRKARRAPKTAWAAGIIAGALFRPRGYCGDLALANRPAPSDTVWRHGECAVAPTSR